MKHLNLHSKNHKTRFDLTTTPSRNSRSSINDVDGSPMRALGDRLFDDHRMQSSPDDAKRIEAGSGTHDGSKPVIPTATENKTEKTLDGLGKAEKVTVRKVPILARGGLTYTPAQVNKPNTLMVLAMQPDLRCDYLVMNTREYMDEEQVVAAKAIGLQYADRFEEIMSKRNEILEMADQTPDVEEQLLYVRMDTADLIREVRSQVHREILNDEQKRIIREKYSTNKTERKAAPESESDDPAATTKPVLQN